MKNELISVIIPVYNVEEYLVECVDSVIAQTYRNLEIILVDDGSTDTSSQICDAYLNKDSRIKVFHQKNQGVSVARNTGIENATGRYIAFADPDDCSHSRQYEFLYHALLDSDSDIAYCAYADFADGNRKQKYVYDGYTQEFVCNHHVLALFNQYLNQSSNPMGYVWNKLYKREVIGEVRFPEGRKVQDYFFNLDVFARAERLVAIREKLYYYRIREGSAIHTTGDNVKLEQDYIAACIHHIDVFEEAGDQKEMIACINAHLNVFAVREVDCCNLKHEASRKAFRSAFVSIFQKYKKYIFQMPDRKKILLARYGLPLYHLLKR